MKKILAVVISSLVVAAFAFPLVGCSKNAETTPPSAGTTAEAPAVSRPTTPTKTSADETVAAGDANTILAKSCAIGGCHGASDLAAYSAKAMAVKAEMKKMGKMAGITGAEVQVLVDHYSK